MHPLRYDPAYEIDRNRLGLPPATASPVLAATAPVTATGTETI